jgi:hypothetical protein
LPPQTNSTCCNLNPPILNTVSGLNLFDGAFGIFGDDGVDQRYDGGLLSGLAVGSHIKNGMPPNLGGCPCFYASTVFGKTGGVKRGTGTALTLNGSPILGTAANLNEVSALASYDKYM